jgi:hypothetical protein
MLRLHVVSNVGLRLVAKCRAKAAGVDALGVLEDVLEKILGGRNSCKIIQSA